MLKNGKDISRTGFLKQIEDSLISIISANLKELCIKNQPFKIPEILYELVEFMLQFTKEKITNEGKIHFALFYKICHSDLQLSSYIFYIVLKSIFILLNKFKETYEIEQKHEEEKMKDVKTLFKGIWDNIQGASKIEKIIQMQIEKFEFDYISEEILWLTKYFDSYVRDNIFLIKCLIQNCRYSQISCKLESVFLVSNIKIIEKTLLTIINKSLEFSSYDQILFWKIINFHDPLAFISKENLVFSLCYFINSLPDIEENAELLDGVFSYFIRRFKFQKEPDLEELSYIFTIQKIPSLLHLFAPKIYNIMLVFPLKQIGSIFQKLMENFLSKQDTKRLANTLEIIASFTEIDEKMKGGILQSLKDDKSFKIHLKGILLSAGKEISPKSNHLLGILLKY